MKLSRALGVATALALCAPSCVASAQSRELLLDRRDVEALSTRPRDGAAARPVVPRSHGARLRYGVSFGVMGAGGDAPSGETVSPAVGGTLQARIGAQISDLFAVYYQAAISGGGVVDVCAGLLYGARDCPRTNAFLAHHASSLVGELTIARGLQIGVGGSASGIVFGNTGSDVQGRLGPLLRVGYAFGGDGPGERRGLTIGAQAHLALALEGRQGPFVDLAISLGWESF